MNFESHIAELRKGAYKYTNLADTDRKKAAEAQSEADRYLRITKLHADEADRYEQLAEGLDLLADALETGLLTAAQLRHIVRQATPDAELTIHDVMSASEIAEYERDAEFALDAADEERNAELDAAEDYDDAGADDDLHAEAPWHDDEDGAF